MISDVRATSQTKEQLDEQPSLQEQDINATLRQCELSLLFSKQPEFLTRSYGTPLNVNPAGKVVVFGLPKSGNVWLVSMLADYLDMPACHPIQDVNKHGVGMCHYPVSEIITTRHDFLHGIYLVRDLRDIIVSYFYNGMTQWFRDDLPNYHYDSIDEFYFEWFLPRVVPYHQIMTHADGFMNVGMPIVRYEKLCTDTARELTRLIKRLGLPYDERRITYAVEKKRFEILKNSGVMLDRMVPTSHFRKGGHGGYKKELPRAVLKHINHEFSRLLLQFGYEIDEVE